MDDDRPGLCEEKERLESRRGRGLRPGHFDHVDRVLGWGLCGAALSALTAERATVLKFKSL